MNDFFYRTFEQYVRRLKELSTEERTDHISGQTFGEQKNKKFYLPKTVSTKI